MLDSPPDARLRVYPVPRRQRLIRGAKLAPSTAVLVTLLIGLFLVHHGLRAEASGPGIWTPTSSMSVTRLEHGATLLPSGEVLVSGGYSDADGGWIISSAELYDPATAGWMSTGSMIHTNVGHAAVLLNDGRVLVAGGVGPDSTNQMAVATAEIYTPLTGAWAATGSMSIPRKSAVATLLPNGKVLVAGGFSTQYGPPESTAEVFDPATGTWAATGSLTGGAAAIGGRGPLSGPGMTTATRLASGKVLFAGTFAAGTGDGAQVYDPGTGTWSETGMWSETSWNNRTRAYHSATLLPNGKVLVVGGDNGNNEALLSAEIYDPLTGTWEVTGTPAGMRFGHTANLLLNGKVLVAGGSDGAMALQSAEVYDPATGLWATAGSMSRARTYHTATLLRDGRVLLTGGSSTGVSSGVHDFAELYQPSDPPAPTGRVVDSAGSGIAGIVIYSDSQFTVTEADGTYNLALAASDQTLTPHEPFAPIGPIDFNVPFLPIIPGVTSGYDFVVTFGPVFDRSPFPVPTPGKTGLVVITHGWTNPSDIPSKPTNCDQEPYRAFKDFEAGLKGHLGSDTKWDVVFYCWAEQSWQQLPLGPLVARDNARRIGEGLGTWVKTTNYAEIHMIGHSASAAMLDAAADRLTDRQVHLTFLDPFIPIFDSSLGRTARWAEGYVNTDDDEAVGTNGLTNSGFFNFDVTAFGNQYGANGGGHGWPIDYYNCTLKRAGAPVVGCPAPVSSTLRGYPLTAEAGGSLQSNRELWGPGGCATLLPTGVAGCAPLLSRLVQVLEPVVVLNQLVSSSTGFVSVVGDAAVRLLTGSPVWIEKTVTVQDHATFVQFEYDFDSTGGTGGVLGVWVDGTYIYGTAEHDALPGVNAVGPIPLPQQLGPGLHKVAFRLDAPTGSSSSIVISNLQTGYERLVTPTLIPVVGASIHNAAHDTISSVAVSTAVHDRVVVTGTGATPAGIVSVSWFGNGTCATPALVTSGATTLVAGAVDLVGFAQTPSSAGTYSFQATYSGDLDYVGATGPCQPLVVGTAPSISGTPTTPATVGTPYIFTFTVTGAPEPTVTKLSGTLPPGLTLSNAGVLSGNPTATGNFSFVVRAANGVTPSAVTPTVTIVVLPTSTGGATAKALKASARNLLLPFLTDSTALARAGNHIGTSLEPGLWIDASHLDARRGVRVFSNERRAAQELAKALRGRATTCAGVVAVELQYTGEVRAQVEAYDVASLRQRLSSFSVTEGGDLTLRGTNGRLLPGALSLVIAGKEVARIPVGCSTALEVGDTFGPFVVTDIVTREVEEPRRVALSAAAAAAALAAQEALVDADEVLARTALGDAEALMANAARRSRVNVLLTQSRREIAAGATSDAAGEAADAIRHYMKAWLHATAAARAAQD